MLLPALLAVLALAPEPPAPPAAPEPQPAPAARPARPPRPPRPAATPRLPALPQQPGAGRLLGEWPEKPSGKKVTLKERMTLDDALERIARAGGWNLAANTGRAGDQTLILDMRDAGVEQALQAVLEGTALAATRRGDSVTVAPGAAPPPAEVPVLSGFDKPTGKKFSGDFEDESVDDAIKQVTDAAGLSVVLPPGLSGAVSAHFKDAPVEDALRVILSQAGLSARREGSIVTVSRTGGRQLVISGGKRRITVDGNSIDIDREVGRAMDEVRRGMREAGRASKEAGKASKALPGHRRGRKDKVLSGDHVVGPGEKAQDVVVLQGNLKMEPGSEAEQVTTIVGDIDLGPGVSVAQEAVAILGDIHVSPGARVGGDAVSIGGKIVIDQGGEVDGQQVSVNVPGLVRTLLPGRLFRPNPWLRAVGIVAEFAVFFVLGLLFLTLAPRRLEAVTASLAHKPLKTVLIGLLATIAMPVLCVLLIATVIGIPLVAVQALGIVVAAVLGFSALALFIGRSAGARLSRGGEVLRLAIGTAAMVAVGQIPVIGTMAWITAWLLVFGAVVRTRFGQNPQAPLATSAVATPPPAPPSPPPAAPA
jgi:hypothetical protein